MPNTLEKLLGVNSKKNAVPVKSVNTNKKNNTKNTNTNKKNANNANKKLEIIKEPIKNPRLLTEMQQIYTKSIAGSSKILTEEKKRRSNDEFKLIISDMIMNLGVLKEKSKEEVEKLKTYKLRRFSTTGNAYYVAGLSNREVPEIYFPDFFGMKNSTESRRYAIAMMMAQISLGLTNTIADISTVNITDILSKTPDEYTKNKDLIPIIYWRVYADLMKQILTTNIDYRSLMDIKRFRKGYQIAVVSDQIGGQEENAIQYRRNNQRPPNNNRRLNGRFNSRPLLREGNRKPVQPFDKYGNDLLNILKTAHGDDSISRLHENMRENMLNSLYAELSKPSGKDIYSGILNFKVYENGSERNFLDSQAFKDVGGNKNANKDNLKQNLFEYMRSFFISPVYNDIDKQREVTKDLQFLYALILYDGGTEIHVSDTSSVRVTNISQMLKSLRKKMGSRPPPRGGMRGGDKTKAEKLNDLYKGLQKAINNRNALVPIVSPPHVSTNAQKLEYEKLVKIINRYRKNIEEISGESKNEETSKDELRHFIKSTSDKSRLFCDRKAGGNFYPKENIMKFLMVRFVETFNESSVQKYMSMYYGNHIIDQISKEKVEEKKIFGMMPLRRSGDLGATLHYLITRYYTYINGYTLLDMDLLGKKDITNHYNKEILRKILEAFIDYLMIVQNLTEKHMDSLTSKYKISPEDLQKYMEKNEGENEEKEDDYIENTNNVVSRLVGSNVNKNNKNRIKNNIKRINNALKKNLDNKTRNKLLKHKEKLEAKA